MSWKDIRLLYVREIRSALRDRAIVTNSIILPIFLYPVMMWLAYTGITFVSGQSNDLKSRIMLKNVPALHSSLKKDFETDKSIVLTDSADPVSDIGAGEGSRIELLNSARRSRQSLSHVANFLRACGNFLRCD